MVLCWKKMVCPPQARGERLSPGKVAGFTLRDSRRNLLIWMKLLLLRMKWSKLRNTWWFRPPEQRPNNQVF
jgi:hypothetical protein